MIAYVFEKYPENFALQLFIVLQQFTGEIAIFLKSNLLFNNFIIFSVYKKNFTAQ